MKSIKTLLRCLPLIALWGACPSALAQAKPVSLFDGTTLKGWKPAKPENAKFWKVIDGVITGCNEGNKVPTNTYLVTEKEFGDFEFRCRFRISGDHKTGLINSGIQYRSSVIEGKMIGYQADIGRGYWGDIYDEHRRGKLVQGNTAELLKTLVEDGWNEYRIRCKGGKHELFINGVKTAEYVEQKEGIAARGILGLQLHSGGVAKVEFKDLSLTEL